MKKIITTMTLVAFILISGTTAHAGAARRHTIEGFLLGTGAVILGTAIIQGMNNDSGYFLHQQPPRPHAKPYRHNRKYGKNCGHHRDGHWEIRQIVVEPVYEEKWNPGHYNPRGKWISGRYERFIVQEGYCREKRVWVRY